MSFDILSPTPARPEAAQGRAHGPSPGAASGAFAEVEHGFATVLAQVHPGAGSAPGMGLPAAGPDRRPAPLPEPDPDRLAGVTSARPEATASTPDPESGPLVLPESAMTVPPASWHRTPVQPGPMPIGPDPGTAAVSDRAKGASGGLWAAVARPWAQEGLMSRSGVPIPSAALGLAGLPARTAGSAALAANPGPGTASGAAQPADQTPALQQHASTPTAAAGADNPADAAARAQAITLAHGVGPHPGFAPVADPLPTDPHPNLPGLSGERAAASGTPLRLSLQGAAMARTEMAAQISGQIARLAASAGEGRIELRLDPPELGRVVMNLTSTDSGTVTALITAERPEIADLLRRHADLLERELRAAGFGETLLQFRSGDQDSQQRAGRSPGSPASGPAGPDPDLTEITSLRLSGPGNRADGSDGLLDIRL